MAINLWVASDIDLYMFWNKQIIANVVLSPLMGFAKFHALSKHIKYYNFDLLLRLFRSCTNLFKKKS